MIETNLNLLEELEYYCKLENPVGALLLTGEWGCGKTYFIENTLRDSLKDTHVIIRISLFGIENIEALDLEIKKAWIISFGRFIKKVEDCKRFIIPIESMLSSISKAEGVSNVISKILSINYYDFINPTNTINDRKVVLVFDDLERAGLNTISILGVINEYCENKHFNVIVVANETRIAKEESSISYNEIKEKIFQRTITYTSDYKLIIRGIIEENEKIDEQYGKFLKEMKDPLICLFSGRNLDGVDLEHISMERVTSIYGYGDHIDRIDKAKEILRQRQHNIRSLKCAVQDFNRIYDILAKKGVQDISGWFLSFTAFMLVYKMGVTNEKIEQGLFSESFIDILYPGYYSSDHMPGCIRDWVTNGVWRQDVIETFFDNIMADSKEKGPADYVRTEKLCYLDEQTIEQGFESVLHDAYEGRLTIDEYQQFISNSVVAREYEIDLPEAIDWNKVYKGITKLINSIIQNEQPYYSNYIIHVDDHFTDDEKKIYKLIDEFKKNDILMFSENRRQYIELMKESGEKAFRVCQNKRMNDFDLEMAHSTSEAFDRADNYEKTYFPGYFHGMWSVIIQCTDYTNNMDKDKGQGFTTLIEDLEGLANKYKKENKAIAKKHAERFCSIVQEIIKEIDNIGVSLH